ncbi:hypothetical protein Sgou_32540 [Streptomyces gougerotii]|uniref:Signal peptidase I n=1 Tax=Streptomyces gougerotii TaxID=53448 RepID=A0ABQ1D7P6_9ACTN|nr:signal peptidase I [Streptomyces gougerotii]GFH78584.1 hypothetical protein Sgou_32540 [Streptomyces gougerotii]
MGARSGREPEGGSGRPEDESAEHADGPGGSGQDDGPDGGRSKGKRRIPFWLEIPFLIVIALGLALLIKTFLVQAFSIPSESMQNALQKGDRVLVDKLTPWFGGGAGARRGDRLPRPGRLAGQRARHRAQLRPAFLSFIGLMPSSEEKDLIKRVIGVPGDTVECNGTGPLKVNGKALDEPTASRATPRAAPTTAAASSR